MHIFISDAHIRLDTSYRGRKLMEFLRKAKPKLQGLYILGDLFEFWFEYNIVFPKDYFQILAQLYNFVQDGIPVHYVLGNHEVMIGSFLRNFGFIVHEEHAQLMIENKRVYIAHGHLIDKRLWTTLWRKLLTSKLNHICYSLIHPDIGVFLAQGIAYLSRKQKRSPRSIAALEAYARQKLQDTDVVMLAHTHIPVFKQYNDDHYYINTGDWITHFSYGVINRSEVALRYYS
jgi:UDP-2,3-diacylglucosamine hydrolase